MSYLRQKLHKVWQYGVWIRLPARFVIHLRSPIRGYRRPKPYTGPPIDFDAVSAALKEAWNTTDAEPFAAARLNRPVRSYTTVPINKKEDLRRES